MSVAWRQAWTDAGGDRRGVRVLVLAWASDLVMAHAVVPALVERRAEIHFLVPRSTAALAKRKPGVAQAHLVGATHGKPVWRSRRRGASRRGPTLAGSGAA